MILEEWVRLILYLLTINLHVVDPVNPLRLLAKSSQMPAFQLRCDLTKTLLCGIASTFFHQVFFSFLSSGGH